MIDWDDFQHYKKRNPPWIKLYNSLLDNEQFEYLQDDSKCLLLCIWMLTSRKGNGKVPADPEYLYKHLPVKIKPDIQPLIKAGFIETIQVNDSNMIAVCKQNATPEQSRDRDRAETDKYLEYVFLSKEEYQKLIITLGSEQLVKERIANLNDAIGSKGYKYKSHYFTLLNWARRDGLIKPDGTPKDPEPNPKKDYLEAERKKRELSKTTG